VDISFWTAEIQSF